MRFCLSFLATQDRKSNPRLPWIGHTPLMERFDRSIGSQRTLRLAEPGGMSYGSQCSRR
jgi:hypothetical protein